MDRPPPATVMPGNRVITLALTSATATATTTTTVTTTVTVTATIMTTTMLTVIPMTRWSPPATSAGSDSSSC